MAYIGNTLQSTSFVTDVFTGDNSTTAFTLSRTPASVTALAVFVDGVKQASIGGSGAYTLTGSVLNFTAAPPTNAIIEVMHLGVQSLVNVPADATVTASALAPELRNILADQWTANGTGTTFAFTYAPISSNSVIVTANGVVQYDYSVSGSTLILNFTPANGTVIRAAGMGNILTTGTITDDSVSTAKLQTNAVTGDKITSNTISSSKLTITGVTAATYGNASSIPAVTVDAQGRITNVTNTAISIPSGSYITGSNNTILTTNTQITANVTIAPNTGGLSIGPVVVDANQTVTVSANARWVIL